jgi:ABC-2 type transport system permease protein
MTDLIRSLQVYGSYFRRFLLARLEYKGDFLFGIFANFIMTASGLLFIFFLVDGRNVPSIGGWRREEVLFIYGYSMIAMAIFTTFSLNLYQFGNRYIIQGQFDRVLLRPLNSLCQVLFESFNLDSIGALITGVGVIVYSGSKLSLDLHFTDLLWLFVSGLSGGVILLSVFVIVCSLSFHFEDRLGIAPPIFNLINFGRYPTPIFHRIIQLILSFVIPFAFVAFYPATHFFDRSGFEVYCYGTPFMALLCASAAAWAWTFGVSRYESTGN